MGEAVHIFPIASNSNAACSFVVATETMLSCICFLDYLAGALAVLVVHVGFRPAQMGHDDGRAKGGLAVLLRSGQDDARAKQIAAGVGFVCLLQQIALERRKSRGYAEFLYELYKPLGAALVVGRQRRFPRRPSGRSGRACACCAWACDWQAWPSRPRRRPSKVSASFSPSTCGLERRRQACSSKGTRYAGRRVRRSGSGLPA